MTICHRGYDILSPLYNIYIIYSIILLILNLIIII